MAMVGETVLPAQAAFRPLAWKEADVGVERRADGSILLWSNHAPGEGPRSIADLLATRAAEHPDRAFMRQRPAPDAPWRTLAYGEALRDAEGIAHYLCDLGLTSRDSVLVLSGNSIEHALVMLGCYAAGVPVAPINPAFSLVSADHAKLRHCTAILRPRLVFARAARSCRMP